MEKEMEVLVDFYKKQRRMMTIKEYNEIAKKLNIANSEMLKNRTDKNWHQLRDEVRKIVNSMITESAHFRKK